MYSLWRGDVLFGQLNPEIPGGDAGAIFGLLDPTLAFPAQALTQHDFGLPGVPVFQHLIEHNDTQSASSHSVAYSSARPRSDVMRDSIPQAHQLTVRDSANEVVRTRSITIMAVPDRSRSLQRLCTNAGVAFSGWMVTAALAD